MNRFIEFIFSVRFASILILVFASVIGYGTFIENDFGRSSAKALIYNTWWFELILILLAVILVVNMDRYKLFRKEKIAVLTFHLAFVVIILGAGVTRYFGFEGMMHIREGDSSNIIVSDDVFLQIKIDNRYDTINSNTDTSNYPLSHLRQYEYDKKLTLSSVSNNKFSVPINFLDFNIKIKYKDFLPNVKDTLDSGDITTLHLIVPHPNGSGMKSEYLKNQEQRKIGDHVFTFNNPLPGAINIKGDSLENMTCNSSFDITSMRMADRLSNQHASNKEFKLNRKTLYQNENLNFVLKEMVLTQRKLISASPKMEDGKKDALLIDIFLDGEKKREVDLIGGKGMKQDPINFTLGRLHFSLAYGSKYYFTPFRLFLRDFQLERYPGSTNESSFASEVTVLDGPDSTDYRIFMNNVLDYQGYRFFQSRFDKDEKGTVLSVNHDSWGTRISYFGYLLLALGIIASFFNTTGRFSFLSRQLKKLKKGTLVVLFSTCSFLSYGGNASQNIEPSDSRINISHAEKFEKLLIQDHGGRIKPVHTLCSELIRKISRKNKINNQTPTQIVLGMTKNPEFWMDVPMIKIHHDSLKIILEIDGSRASFKSFHDSTGSVASYKLKELIRHANSVDVSKRGKLEKAVIAVSERYDICYAIYNGTILSSMFRFFPLKGDPDNTWYGFSEYSRFSGIDSLFVSNIIPLYYQTIVDTDSDWTNADSLVYHISQFQNGYGGDIVPGNFKRDLEISYNKINIFSNLFMYYFIIGLLLLLFILIQIFQDTKFIRFSIQTFKWLVFLGILAQTFGLIARWIISEHAPWTNGYESMIYIAWASMIAGVIFHKKSHLTLAATSIVASLLLMVAHLNWLDPEITNIVPVLNSYWLMIHVSIITASYGFLSLGAILGLLSLWVIIFTSKKNVDRLRNVVNELTLINEKTLMVGLFMLAIGTFLGGIWASESWGRYWGWDPKETWALISILVYVFVLHMRLIPSLSGVYTFNLASLIAIGSIIMTYFGVNYYLSGLHSYAKGDPMPIPVFIYYFIGLIIITSILAKTNSSKYYK